MNHSITFNVKSRIFQIWKKNRSIILWAFFSTLFWSLIAHAYVFFQNSFTHDSLNEFNASVFGNEWKIQLGRIFVPIYRFFFRSNLTLPWLIGAISILFITISVIFIVKIFNIQSKINIFLISAIFSCNITIISQSATYINDLDANMLALLCSVIAVYLWKENKYQATIPFFIALSLGLYQSYVSVTITLVLFVLILSLLNEQDYKTVFFRGLEAIGFLILGGIIYFLSIKIVTLITGLSLVSNTYNSLDHASSLSISNWIYTIIIGYFDSLHNFISVTSIFPKLISKILHLLLGVFILYILIFMIINKCRTILDKLLLLFLSAIIPLGMNISYILSGGTGHDLTHYAFWLYYLFLLLLINELHSVNFTIKKSIYSLLKNCTVVILLFIFWGNAQLANAVYLQKDLLTDATQSLFTRIIYDMNNTENYISGKTPVVFIGDLNTILDSIPGYENIYLTGLNQYQALGAAGRDYYQHYFDYIMLDKAVMVEKAQWNELQQDNSFANMPSYPEKGSIQVIDGILVVKLSDTAEE